MLRVRSFDRLRDARVAEEVFERDFGGRVQVRRGEAIDVLAQEGLVAEDEGCVVGFLLYRVDGTECEVTWMAALERRRGIGTALLRALRERRAECERFWLVTTNDNRTAQAFYESRGFRVREVRPGAVRAARRLKPAIPLLGEGGVPILDEIEYELRPTRTRDGLEGIPDEDARA